MVDITHLKTLCLYPDCDKQSSYNYENETLPTHCLEHKKDDMVDIRGKKCIYKNGCVHKPSFNFENEEKALYCSKHKLDSMVNIYLDFCLEIGCNVYPSFNYKNEKKKIYCSEHKKEGMIILYSKKCLEPDCETAPSYNYENENTKIYCGKHKKLGMIHLSLSLCRYEDCTKFPTYNLPGLYPRYCLKHKTPEMINVVDKRCLVCPTIASFNYPGLYPEYCALHKDSSMINTYAKLCKTQECNLSISNKNRYDGYCLECYKNLFPESKITINYKVKEKTVSNFIKETFPDYNWIFDKVIKNGISKRRPDVLLELSTHYIIVEIDEEQHSEYGYISESNRIKDIRKDIDYKDVVFIRFNTDSYTNSDNIITDDFRIISSMETIKSILSNNPKYIILTSHFGRPKNKESIYSLNIILPLLEKYLGRKIIFLEHGISKNTLNIIKNNSEAIEAKEIPIYLLENLRYHDQESNYENYDNNDKIITPNL